MHSLKISQFLYGTFFSRKQHFVPCFVLHYEYLCLFPLDFTFIYHFVLFKVSFVSRHILILVSSAESFALLKRTLTFYLYCLFYLLFRYLPFLYISYLCTFYTDVIPFYLQVIDCIQRQSNKIRYKQRFVYAANAVPFPDWLFPLHPCYTFLSS